MLEYFFIWKYYNTFFLQRLFPCIIYKYGISQFEWLLDFARSNYREQKHFLVFSDYDKTLISFLFKMQSVLKTHLCNGLKLVFFSPSIFSKSLTCCGSIFFSKMENILNIQLKLVKIFLVGKIFFHNFTLKNGSNIWFWLLQWLLSYLVNCLLKMQFCRHK